MGRGEGEGATNSALEEEALRLFLEEVCLTDQRVGQTFQAEGGLEWKLQAADGSGAPQFHLGEKTSLKG